MDRERCQHPSAVKKALQTNDSSSRGVHGAMCAAHRRAAVFVHGSRVTCCTARVAMTAMLDLGRKTHFH